MTRILHGLYGVLVALQFAQMTLILTPYCEITGEYSRNQKLLKPTSFR